VEATTNPSQRSRVEALDLLRLLAALSVVVYHYTFRGAAADGLTNLSIPALVPVTKYAYLGVELFFVISGFVIAFSAEGRAAREFVIARAARIYPGFLVCMTLTFLVTLAFGAPHFEASLTQWLANLVILSPALKQPFMDGVYWSIVYELIFYAWTFALIVLGLFSRRLLVVVALWLVLSAANEFVVDSSILRRLLITDDSGFFCAGLMLYALYAGRRGALALLLLGASTALAATQSVLNAAWIHGHFAEPFSDTVIGTASVGIVALVGLCLLVKRVPLPATLVIALGGLTYPLYLLHQQVGFILFNQLEGLAPAPLIVAGTLVLMLGLSFAVWRLVERPGQSALKAALSRILAWPPAARRQHATTAVFGPVRLPRAVRP
jgi:peptidoglycan/LPS O-acetylase OafA/YrhL